MDNARLSGTVGKQDRHRQKITAHSGRRPHECRMEDMIASHSTTGRNRVKLEELSAYLYAGADASLEQLEDRFNRRRACKLTEAGSASVWLLCIVVSSSGEPAYATGQRMSL